MITAQPLLRIVVFHSSKWSDESNTSCGGWVRAIKRRREDRALSAYIPDFMLRNMVFLFVFSAHPLPLFDPLKLHDPKHYTIIKPGHWASITVPRDMPGLGCPDTFKYPIAPFRRRNMAQSMSVCIYPRNYPLYTNTVEPPGRKLIVRTNCPGGLTTSLSR